MHQHPNQLNARDDGRGVYFDDPDGYRLKLITRPYGNAGTDAGCVHPLLAPTIEPDPGSPNRQDVH